MSSRLRFEYRPASADPATTLYVDGTEPGFRSLSHWPGNSTPAALKHDLSTGIALGFVARPAAEQRALLGDFEVVANNHYDTDGVASAFALLFPELALPWEEELLAAAGTGDFSVWCGEDALALDLTITALAHARTAPFAAALPPEPDDDARHAAAYAWLLRELPALLEDPHAWRSLWAEDFERIVADVQRIEEGTGISVRRFEDADLALVSSDRPLTSIGLHLAAGDKSRVLAVLPSREGFRYRYRERVESWFELVSRRVSPRGDLAPVVAALNAAEGSARGAPAQWWWQPPTFPVRELGFGDPSRATQVNFGDPQAERDPPSKLLPSAVVDLLRGV